jgi:hypothetical protein
MTTVRSQVEAIIREELGKSGVAVAWDMREVHVLPDSKIVIEYTSSEGSLSQALIEHFFPSEAPDIEVAHFTSTDSFRSIVTSNELRLFSPLKRISEQEFRPFSEDFGLSGYLDTSNGEPYYKTLMGSLFYTSFTQPQPPDPSYMWQVFGDQGRGVKLIFKVSPIESRAEFRRVRYSSKNEAAKSLIGSITRRIQQECGRHFIMRGISRVGAFYLPLGYSLETEKETRLLVKSWGEGPAHKLVLGQGDDAYLPLALGSNANQFCLLNLVEVQSGSNSDKAEIDRILMNSRSSGARRSDA